jgi:O-antigen/teichoic acid export membrane protein
VSERLATQAGSAFFWKGTQTAVLKGIYLVRTLVLARLLLPDDFGLLAIALLAVDFLANVTNLGMVPALVQRDYLEERHYNAAWTAGITRALLISLIALLAAPVIASLFKEPRAAVLIRVLAIRPLLDAAASIRIAELTRNLQFRSLSIIRMGEAIVNTIVSISLAWSYGVWALVAGTLAGQIAYLILSYILAPHRPRLLFQGEAIKPLIRFGRWIFLSGLIAVTASSLLQVVISRQLGVAEVGLYYLAAKLALIPYEISSEVIGSVAFPLYARLQSDLQKVTRAFRALLVGMSALIVPVCALMIALAPGLVENVLGEKWGGTVPIIRLLVLLNIIGLFGDAVSPILKGVGRPHQVLMTEVVQSSLLIGLAWYLTGTFGVTGAALAWLLAVGTSQILSVLFIHRVIPRPLKGLWRPLAVIMAIAGFGTVLAVLISDTLNGQGGLMIAGIIAAAVMGALLWAADRYLDFHFVNDLARTFPQIAAWMRISPSET